MSKRRAEDSPPKTRAPKKNSLDSDEEDEEDNEAERIPDQRQHLDAGEEATIDREGDVKITPFNMKEELEEGHFDKQGHFHWKKEKEIEDNWLDNIDWVQIQSGSKDKYKINSDDSSNDTEDENTNDTDDKMRFDSIVAYKKMLTFMREKETVLQALRRLGPKKVMSSTERWKQKKAGITDSDTKDVTILTSIANEILTKTGNMDVYQQTYEKIKSIISAVEQLPKNEAELDMYADDFDVKEKEKKEKCKEKMPTVDDLSESELMWEFKWSQDENAEIYGPHSTDQMQLWVKEGYFKDGVWVRKCGIEGPFYTSNRIDFELYL